MSADIHYEEKQVLAQLAGHTKKSKAVIQGLVFLTLINQLQNLSVQFYSFVKEHFLFFFCLCFYMSDRLLSRVCFQLQAPVNPHSD